MLKIENVVTPSPEQWRSAIMGARNPMNSWDRSDSEFEEHCLESWPHNTVMTFENLGSNDHDLLMRLRNAGTDHRKFMRMITVYVDITGPLYWWKEFDTYKVGTVANSCSTMHKIAAKEFTLEDFSCEHLIKVSDSEFKDEVFFEDSYHIRSRMIAINGLELIIEMLNHYRKLCLETKDKRYWWQMIQLLPSSYNQRRTVMLNYEVLAGIYQSRKDHKLDEWRELCKWIEGLPYSEIITGMSESEKTLWIGEKLHEGFKDGLEHPDPAIIDKWNSVSGGYPVTSEDIIANAMAEAYGCPPIDPKKLDPAERTTDTGKAMKDIMDKLNEKG